MRIGVLALQGDFAKHIAALTQLNVDVLEVRKPQDLELCDGLIIPGGESTTMLRQIDFIQMREPLLEFAEKHSVFGTCAGLILMSRQVQNFPLKPLQLLNIEVERNAFGRQVDSFQTDISVELKMKREGAEADKEKSQMTVPAFFIRAPRIKAWGKEVEILGCLERVEGEEGLERDEPVPIRQGRHLGASFHPELTSDLRVHQYFIEMI